MKRKEAGWLLMVGLGALAGCVHATRSAAISVVEVQSVEGKASQASMAVPRDWIPLAPSVARAEFIGPDRRSRIYLRAMPAAPASKSCETLTQEYARQVIESWGGPPRSVLIGKQTAKSHVDFELRRTDPKPYGERIWSRVGCRAGVLAVVSCAGPTPEEHDLALICRVVLDSLEIGAAQERKPTARR